MLDLFIQHSDVTCSFILSKQNGERKEVCCDGYVALNKLLDSYDEKPTRTGVDGRENGYFNTIVQELKIEDRIGFSRVRFQGNVPNGRWRF